ncbi:MAG: hypothetical protein NTZ32_22020 [Planctomycetales bacterium]|nr:hypothetical protein [Planctomycetales bacterium]
MTNHGTNGRPPVLPGCSVLPPMEPPRPRPGASTSKGTEKPKRTAVTSNRFGELNAFVDCSMADLSRAEALTWLVLWRDTKNGTVRTSMTDVARRIGTTRRAVVDAVPKLEKRGLLFVVYRGGLKRGMNVYRVQPMTKPPG